MHYTLCQRLVTERFSQSEICGIGRIHLCAYNQQFIVSDDNPKSAKFLKIHLEMEWVDLWQLVLSGL